MDFIHVWFCPGSLDYPASGSWPSRKYQVWAPFHGVGFQLDQYWFIVVLRQDLEMFWNCGDHTGLEVRVPRPWPPKCCGVQLIAVLKVLSLLILLKKHRPI